MNIERGAHSFGAREGFVDDLSVMSTSLIESVNIARDVFNRLSDKNERKYVIAAGAALAIAGAVTVVLRSAKAVGEAGASLKKVMSDSTPQTFTSMRVDAEE